MFKRNKFIINQNTITVYPYYERLPIIVGFTALCIIPLSFALFFAQKPYDSTSNRYLYSSVIFFVFIIGLFLTQSIIFDENKKAVFRRIFMMKKRIYNFDEVYGVVPVTLNKQGGIYYKITSKKDKYGKGIRISPGYRSANHKYAIEFQEKVLTRVQQMLNSSILPAITNLAGIYDFKYYSIENSVYRLKMRKTGLLWAVIVLAVAIYFNVKFPPDFSVRWPIGQYIIWGFGFLFPPIAAFVSTHKLVFDCNTQTIRSVYAFNSFKKEFPFADFVRFQIVRSSTNGIYSDTRIWLVFTSGKMFALKSFYRTRKIEGFINETEAILKMKS
ncbi:MAG: hypothetical protein WBP45_00325 [Daejeonella sp.]